MKDWLLLAPLLAWSLGVQVPAGDAAERSTTQRVFILPVRDDIEPPLTYVIRRGVKEAMEAHADLLVLDMDTNGGRLDVTEEIIGILGKFNGQTVTYVNRKAFSAGAFIAVATQKIFMAEESVIGAATPIILVPGGGPVEMPASVEAKMTSGVKALIRAKAERNGYNIDVIEAMIDRNKELILDGKVINPKGQILTLTSSEAARTYGDPPRPLLSSGTLTNIDDLLVQLGFASAQRTQIRPTGVEHIGFWINTISPLLLAIGAIGIYMEFKTPGFGVPGVIAIVALLLYFLGGYLAGLSGIEWVAVFALGVIFIALELFLFPGTLALGVIGALLVFVSLVMAFTDLYPGLPGVPGLPGFPAFPTLPQLQLPLRNFALAGVLAAAGVWCVGSILPKTPAYRALVSTGTSGGITDSRRDRDHASQLGRQGVAVSVLRPGGKAQFEDDILDVVTRGEHLERGTRVRIVGHSAKEAIVETIPT